TKFAKRMQREGEAPSDRMEERRRAWKRVIKEVELDCALLQLENTAEDEEIEAARAALLSGTPDEVAS
ncbi:MAG: hypothetical protein AAF368_04530, partial [Planctomycetota bacterium]